MKRSFKRLLTGSTLLAALLSVVLLPASGALASGETYTEGNAYQGSYYYYYNSRSITYAPTPGPEVAFNQDYGPAGLQLGAHNCSGSILSGPYAQTPGVWEPVAYLSTGTTFCVVTYSSSGSAGFGGTIAWD